VDFIGGEGILTIAEEAALADYFRQRRSTTRQAQLLQHRRKIKHPD